MLVALEGGRVKIPPMCFLSDVAIYTESIAKATQDELQEHLSGLRELSCRGVTLG